LYLPSVASGNFFSLCSLPHTHQLQESITLSFSKKLSLSDEGIGVNDCFPFFSLCRGPVCDRPSFKVESIKGKHTYRECMITISDNSYKYLYSKIWNMSSCEYTYLGSRYFWAVRTGLVLKLFYLLLALSDTDLLQ
jgi:hypothetical protein